MHAVPTWPDASPATLPGLNLQKKTCSKFSRVNDPASSFKNQPGNKVRQGGNVLDSDVQPKGRVWALMSSNRRERALPGSRKSGRGPCGGAEDSCFADIVMAPPRSWGFVFFKVFLSLRGKYCGIDKSKMQGVAVFAAVRPPGGCEGGGRLPAAGCQRAS